MSPAVLLSLLQFLSEMYIISHANGLSCQHKNYCRLDLHFLHSSRSPSGDLELDLIKFSGLASRWQK